MRKTAERRSQHRIHRIHRVLVEVAVQALVVSWWKPPHATSHLAPNGVECGDPKPPCGKRCVFSSRSRMKKLEYTRQMYFQGSFSECHPISSRISVATGSGIDLDGQCTVHISGAAGNHKSGVLLCFDEISGLLFQWAPKSDLAFNDFEMAKLQGLPLAVTNALMAAAQDLLAGSFGAAVGDAMSINVLQTMLRHLCDAAGMFDLPESHDFWRQCPKDTVDVIS